MLVAVASPTPGGPRSTIVSSFCTEPFPHARCLNFSIHPRPRVTPIVYFLCLLFESVEFESLFRTSPSLRRCPFVTSNRPL